MAVHFEGEDLQGLFDELHRLQQRYGVDHTEQPKVPLEGSIKRRRHRIAQIHRQIEELAEEAATLERELLGYRAGMVARLTDQIERMRSDHHEGWSPTPVWGYRMWALLRDRVEGVRTVWRTSRLEAECRDGFPAFEVPHTDGRCGRLGCGVYAAKRPEPILMSFKPERGHGYIAGRVALTGKVVEHDLGYRAQLAEAVSIVAAGPKGVLATRDRSLIGRLFDRPFETMSTEPLQQHWTDHMTVEYLTEIEEEPWTSASNEG